MKQTKPPPTPLISQIKSFFKEFGRMPSYSELAKLLSFKSKCGAQNIVKKLIAVGAVTKDAKGKLLPGGLMRPLKILGTVEAGFPSPAEEENVDTISLDNWLIHNKEAVFMLKVSGDSMIDAGIIPGDFVIVERGKHPKSGDIVVAEVDSKWTIKYFHKNSETAAAASLEPANKKYSTITAREEIRIAGVVTSSIRKYCQ